MKKQEKNNNMNNTKKSKKKRGSIDKKIMQINNPNINSAHFWDINLDNDEINIINNYNISTSTSINNNNNTFSNKYKNRSLEKEKNNNFYNKFTNVIKTENKEINNNNNNNNTTQINLIPYKKEKNNNNKIYNRNKSVDLNKINKKKNKNIKIDILSVFERNKKWLDYKKAKLDKAIEKYNNKKENEILENTLQYKMNKKKDIDINNIFNEEDNVINKRENENFFIRLFKGRQEREKALDLNSYVKINCLKRSHYSYRPNVNMSQKEMKKYIKYIHNELKETTNQN